MRKLLLLYNVLVLMKDIWCKDNNRTTVNGDIGETVVLPCDVDGSFSHLRWRKESNILIQDCDVNPLITGYERLKIDTKQVCNLTNVSVYNLIISNVTADDFGDYWCVVQGHKTHENGVFLKQIEDTRIQQNVPVEQNVGKRKTKQMCAIIITYSTEMISNNAGINTGYKTETQSGLVTEEVTISVTAEVNTVNGYPESTTRTERTSKFDKTLINSENDGVSLLQMFYYGLLLAGLILVISFSISCNVYIIRKCKFRENLNIADGRHLNQMAVNVQDAVEVNIPEEEGAFYSQYETINESEMIQLPVVQHFDTIVSDIITNTSNTKIYQRQINATSPDRRTSSSSLEDHSNTNSTINSDSLSEGSTPGENNGYPNQYVELNINDMEYLHSYSGLVKKEDVSPSTSKDGV